MRKLLAATTVMLAIGSVRVAWAAEPTPQMVADELVAFVGFVAGEPLATDERARLDAGVLRRFAANRAEMLNSYARQLAITSRAAHDPARAMVLRRSNRAVFYRSLATAPADSLSRDAYEIVARHDPVVAYDAARDILFTQRTLAYLHAAAAWAAGLAGAPGPAPDFDAQLAADLPHALPAMDSKLAHEMAEIDSTQFYARPWPRDGGGANLARDIQAVRPRLDAPSADPAWRLATFASVLSDHLAGNEIALARRALSPGNAALANLFMGNITRQMQLGNMRSMGYACMHQQASVSYCQGGNE